MTLTQLTPRIWATSHEERRDRPALGYVLGEKYAVAVDAGHSQAHLAEFYALLRENGLPLPELTILTHWHWDHTFAIHAVHGRTLAGKATQVHLQGLLDGWHEGTAAEMKAMDAHIAAEYETQPMVVRPADVSFEGELGLDLGGVTVRCLHVPSPHTDDAVVVLAEGKGVVFFGDAMCGVYPEWVVDPARMARFRAAMEALDFSLAVGGHWAPFTRAAFFRALEV